MNHHSSNSYRPPSRMNTSYEQRRPIPTNSRLDFLKAPTQIQTHSPKKDPLPINPRVSSLKNPTANTYSYVKKGFVAFPTKSQWEQGFRPAWILDNKRDPPDDYLIAYGMFQNYKKTGNVIYPKYMNKKKKEDKASSIAAAFNHKHSK